MIYRFDQFELDADELELREEGATVALQELPLRLLVALVERAGRQVSRQELKDRLWPGVDFQDFDNSLNSAINRLRQALGDSAAEPRFIATVPRRGYKFLARAEPLPAEPAGPSRSRRAAVAAGALASLAAVTVLVVLGTRDETPRAEQASDVASHDAEAHYLRGLHFTEQRTRAGLERAIAELQAAIARDAEHAAAYGRLGVAYAMLGWYDYWPPREAVPTATAMANKALELDTDSAEGHLALSIVRAFEWRWPEARRHATAALESAPELADSRAWMGALLAMTGDLESGVREMRTAVDLAPTSAPLRADLCWHLFNAGRPEAAIDACREAIELAPTLLDAHDNLKWIYIHLDEEAEAARQFARVVDLEGGDAASVRGVFERSGLPGLLRDSLATLLRRDSQGYQSPYDIALEYAALGERDAALDWLERSLAERETDLTTLAIDVRLESLRGETRFQRVVAAVGADVETGLRAGR